MGSFHREKVFQWLSWSWNALEIVDFVEKLYKEIYHVYEDKNVDTQKYESLV